MVQLYGLNQFVQLGLLKNREGYIQAGTHDKSSNLYEISFFLFWIISPFKTNHKVQENLQI